MNLFLLIISLIMILLGTNIIIKNKKEENKPVSKNRHKWIILGMINLGIGYIFFIIFINQIVYLY